MKDIESEKQKSFEFNLAIALHKHLDRIGFDRSLELDINSEQIFENEVIELVEQLLQEQREEMKRVNRVEVIDQNGRSYVNWDDKNNVDLSFQDEGRTLKIFIDRLNTKD